MYGAGHTIAINCQRCRVSLNLDRIAKVDVEHVDGHIDRWGCFARDVFERDFVGANCDTSDGQERGIGIGGSRGEGCRNVGTAGLGTDGSAGAQGLDCVGGVELDRNVALY